MPVTHTNSFSAKKMFQGRRRGMMLRWGGLRNHKATIIRVAALACTLQFDRATSSRVFASGPFWGKGQHTFFNPLEQKIQPNAFRSLEPPILDPTQEGSFARHTLHNRLTAVCERYLRPGLPDDTCCASSAQTKSGKKILTVLQRIAASHTCTRSMIIPFKIATSHLLEYF